MTGGGRGRLHSVPPRGSDGAGGLSTERQKASRGKGQGGLTASLRERDWKAKGIGHTWESRLLSASSEQAAALPAHESISLVWPRVPGWPLMCWQREARPHTLGAGKHSLTWPGVDSPAWGPREAVKALPSAANPLPPCLLRRPPHTQAPNLASNFLLTP